MRCKRQSSLRMTLPVTTGRLMYASQPGDQEPDLTGFFLTALPSGLFLLIQFLFVRHSQANQWSVQFSCVIQCGDLRNSFLPSRVLQSNESLNQIDRKANNMHLPITGHRRLMH